MHRNTLEAYAQKARRDFIAAVTDRAAFYGLTAGSIDPVVETGDVALIGAHAFPGNVVEPRERLEERIQRDGFEQVMEAMAYTWFNRFAAIRYMELHGYLDHGYRILSHPEGKDQPEILEHAADVDLPGLDREKTVELKLDGSKDEKLYRLLLSAQCSALHQAMPFLFERIGDETELLLPANLLHTDSLIRQMVESIDESAWEEIEIVGWLYQFYISEKKDQVIGNVVASEDIPAATQLFTPNWIVKYMVQNSLGAQWLATYPHSQLKRQLEYYIEPAEQTDEVRSQLKAITPGALDPEELTLIDPACGSGHILVEAYDLFRAIYMERGYQKRDVVQLILEKNLFGLDIDVRAAQLTGFALMMKGRADDRRLFERGVELNVMALVGSTDFDAARLAERVELAYYGLGVSDLTAMKRMFEHATTFGSLIRVPEGLAEKLPALKQLSEATSRDLFVVDALKRSGQLVRQAELLAAKYDVVVANPPYMGGKYQNSILKEFARLHFPNSKSDLFAVSTERFLAYVKPSGFVGLMTSFTWMFLKSYEAFRKLIIERETLQSLVHPEYHALFDTAFVPVCTFVIQNCHTQGFNAAFIRLADFSGADAQPKKTLEAIRNPECGWFYRARPDDFEKIPGSPLAYWAGPRVLDVFGANKSLGDLIEARQGMATADNGRFIRQWSEVSVNNTGFGITSREEAEEAQCRWFPYNKGGDFRKWYGNQEYVVNWDRNGRELKSFEKAVVRNPGYYFRTSVSWSDVTASTNAFRWYPAGFIFDSTGHSAFPASQLTREQLLCLCNNCFTQEAAAILNPTMHFHVGYFNVLPAAVLPQKSAEKNAEPLIEAAHLDWNAYERSWDFQSLPILTASAEPTPSLESSYASWITQNLETIAQMKSLEEENNRLFIDAYGLQDELTPDVPIGEITLTVNPAYRYGGNLTEEERWTRFRRDTMKELVSYAIGCMMGRYSLDAPGLIYAQGGNVDFDPIRYTTFPADSDGIIPIIDGQWFDDDAAHCLTEFISVTWDKARLEDNLAFLADSLAPKKNESSHDTIRRYLCDSFFKDHMQTYKNRPIYWLFSSGRNKAFQCLVYLHRYNEGTLARIRSEYVIPLQGMMASRVHQLKGDIDAVASTAHRNRLEKERATLVKQQSELQEFDEKLRHYADQRIAIDLDDGVKVNYRKFGALLAEVKTVTGKNTGA